MVISIERDPPRRDDRQVSPVEAGPGGQRVECGQERLEEWPDREDRGEGRARHRGSRSRG